MSGKKKSKKKQPSKEKCIFKPEKDLITKIDELMPKIPVRFEFVITTIDVIEIEYACPVKYGEDAKVVELHGHIQGRKHDNDVAFLLKFKSTNVFGDDKVMIYEAIKVSKRVFQKHLLAHNKKFLACIHGFTVEPETFFPRCAYMQNHQNFSHTLIPIVWPSIDIPPADERSPIQNAGFYKKEKKITYQAGKALKAIGDLGTRISLSLMAHSMGNRVFMSYVKHAAVEQRFEAIFLVAADIWEEVFNTRVIENKLPFWNRDNEWADTGLKMCKMLKRGGKIHILRYKCDITLTLLSRIMNRRQRLGVHGKPGQEACNRIHKDCKDKLVDVDMARFAKKVKKFHKNGHCYHIMPETITYYNDVMKKG